MITKNFLKTAIAGLMDWVNARFARFEMSETELLSLLSEMSVVEPVASADGDYYVDNKDRIYIL